MIFQILPVVSGKMVSFDRMTFLGTTKKQSLLFPSKQSKVFGLTMFYFWKLEKKKEERKKKTFLFPTCFMFMPQSKILTLPEIKIKYHRLIHVKDVHL